MSNLNRIALLLVPLAACVTDGAAGSEVDDAISEDEAGKADEVQAYKHYLLYSDGEGAKLARANGGRLRCPDDELREVCDVTSADLVPTLGFTTSPSEVFAELAEHPVIIQGRLVRVTGEDRVYLRGSTLRRGLTAMVPSDTTSCYRIKKLDSYISYEKVDSTAKPIVATTTFFDYVDPTPDDWNQPTEDVQTQIDRAVDLSVSRRVYACGEFEEREPDRVWFWTSQVFAAL